MQKKQNYQEIKKIINSKYSLKEIEEKLERFKNMKLEDVKLDDVDEISSIKINRRKPNTDKTADDSVTNVLKNLYK